MQIKTGLHSAGVHAQGHADACVDICLLGGGPVGAVAMLLARQHGLSAVQIVPKTVPPEARTAAQAAAVPRTYAIAPRVQAGLAQLGVWGLLSDTQVQRCDDMRVFWQQGDYTEPLHLNAAQAGAEQLCSFVSEHDLLTALQTVLTVSRAAQQRIDYAPEHYPDLAPVSDGMRVCVAGHTPVMAKLCLIAEGPNSQAAQRLGAAATVYDYQHSAVVAIVHSTAPSVAQPQAMATSTSTSTAWQWLGGAAQGHDVLALLPLPSLPKAQGCARYGLVWSQPNAQAQSWLGREAQLLAALQARVGSPLGTLSLHSAVQQFPLFKSDALFLAASAALPHTALVGDTAHKIHPLAGQGLNLGFEDVFALFEVLAQREPWRSVGDARLLARYQRRRKGRASAMGALVHAVASRGRWPALASHGALKLLALQNDWPWLGKPLRSLMVKTAVNAAAPRSVQ